MQTVLEGKTHTQVHGETRRADDLGCPHGLVCLRREHSPQQEYGAVGMAGRTMKRYRRAHDPREHRRRKVAVPAYLRDG
jgi:hypothetical protein